MADYNKTDSKARQKYWEKHSEAWEKSGFVLLQTESKLLWIYVNINMRSKTLSKKTRKNYTPEEKAGIIKEHLVEKVHVSDLCDKYGLHLTVFYRWQKEFFENAALAFEKRRQQVAFC